MKIKKKYKIYFSHLKISLQENQIWKSSMRLLDNLISNVQSYSFEKQEFKL